MLSLIPIDRILISKWLVDFQKKAKTFELPPEDSTILGIYSDFILVGYFVLVEYKTEGILEINQGYLLKEARHKHFDIDAMHLLEQAAKNVGYKQISLKVSRSFRAYKQFIQALGYKQVSIIFSKEV